MSHSVTPSNAVFACIRTRSWADQEEVRDFREHGARLTGVRPGPVRVAQDSPGVPCPPTALVPRAVVPEDRPLRGIGPRELEELGFAARSRGDDERCGAGDGTGRTTRSRGPLPADPADDVNLSPELLALKQAAEQRLAEWQASGRGLGASSLADAAVFCSSGLGDAGRHDVQIIFFLTGTNEDFLRAILNIDTGCSSTMRGSVSRTTPKIWCCSPTRSCRTAEARSSSTAPIPPPRRRFI